MSLKSHIQGTAAYILFVVGTVAGAEVAPQQESSSLPLADWGYILRGALFIFASAMAMVWIGRKISKRQK